MISRENLYLAEEYLDIHAVNHDERTDQGMYLDFLEKEEKNVNNINGIGNQSLFFEFPYFDTSKGHS